jgi:NADH-quinone oxidoreductase subunit H
MLKALFQILIFPGLLFLFVFSTYVEFIDRRIHARLQNRKGPPWFQPVADMIKLLGKENVVPEEADLFIFKLMPLIALTAAICAVLYIPIWGTQASFSFDGDLIVVLYLLTLPSLAFFLGGWYSRSIYAMVGSMRALVQLFAYEVPLFLAILAPALLANTWSLSKMAAFYADSPWLWFCNLLGFFVALVALLGKLEKVPFDIPEAETEIVAGSFTEYSGKRLAFLRMALDIEMVVGASLLAAVYLPWGMTYGPLIGFIFYLLKMLLVVFLISLGRSLFARMRIDQMIEFCWKYMAPLAFVQLLLCLLIKGVLH